MTTLRARWDALALRIDAMTVRERVLIFGAISVVFLVLVNALLLDPLALRDKAVQQQMHQTQEKTALLNAQLQALMARANEDPDAALQTRLQALREQAERSGKTLTDIQSGLVPPQRMTAMLEDILRRNHALHLVALKTLPVTGLLEPTAAAATRAATNAVLALAAAVPPASAAGQSTVSKSAPVPTIRLANAGSAVYQHGVELTVSGSYLDMVRYLSELEALPWHMFWGRVDLNVEQYPKVNLTLRLYTLSLDPAWLAL